MDWIEFQAMYIIIIDYIYILQWRRPVLIDLAPAKVQSGYGSQERGTQQEREVSVLAAIYFSKAS